MTENSDVCSINRCPSPAVAEERGQVGSWYVTILYCDEHSRNVRDGTPIGPVGVDASKVIVEPVGADQPPATPGRFPGIA